MDRHGNCARVVVGVQLNAVNMAGERSADMCGPFILFLQRRSSMATAHNDGVVVRGHGTMAGATTQCLKCTLPPTVSMMFPVCPVVPVVHFPQIRTRREPERAPPDPITFDPNVRLG